MEEKSNIEIELHLSLFKRWLIFFIGIMILGLGIALVIRADLGSAPWDVLHIGLHHTIGLTIGTWTVIVGFLLLFITYLVGRELPKIGTWVNIVFVGVFVDIFLFIFSTPDSIVVKMLMLLLGIILMGFGAGVYISPRLGAGPRDSLMLVVSKKTKLSVAQVRSVMEIGVLIIGWLLGGPVFVGTIIVSLTIGYVTGISLKICQYWLDQRMERGIKVENIN